MAPQRTSMVVARPAGADIARNHVGDSLDHFAAQELEKRTSTRPAPLSVEEHAEHRKQLEGVRFIIPRYADQTEINIGGIQAKWER
ncbi:hypothetical protein BKA60DRAFT_571817 [Fusarium oxysporum]|nr:hypothetical protein BKA60DRAFT_571817 [Fusarium oxysporum]